MEPKSLFAYLCPFGVPCCFLILFLQFPSTAMASGSKEGESHVFPLFWLFRAQAPCMLVPILDHIIP